jgi:PTH2 family peptidyl-tRNA hydrolase
MERIAKQVIVMRKDLNMRKGKMVAQGAHASMAAVLDRMVILSHRKEIQEKTLILESGTPMESWINGLFTKVCVSVDSESELIEIYEKAKDAGLIASIITDAGLTEFSGVPTKTCIAIGPNWADEIDPVTNHLKLL